MSDTLAQQRRLGLVSAHGVVIDVPEGHFEGGEPHTVIRFAGPSAPGWSEALRDRGVRVRFWCPPRGACVALPASLPAARLGEVLPFVIGAVPYRQTHCSRQIAPPSTARERAGVAVDWVDIVCFSREERALVERALAQRGVEILDLSSCKIRVSHAGDLAPLRRLPGVKLADRARMPALLGSVSMAACVGAADTSGRWAADLDGDGEVIGVVDTGLDSGALDATLHQDFEGRVEHLSSWPLNPSWSSIAVSPGHDDGAADLHSGHGTHVAGLAVGSGGKSGGELRGIAPRARLVFQAIEQRTEVKADMRGRVPSGFYLSGRPLDLRDLLRRASERGAVIHLNAWGDPADGAYTDDCHEIDLFLHENPDALVLFAAGNDGADLGGDRRPDRGSLNAPASAKNVIAVGATEGPLAGVGARGTWADLDPQNRRYRARADRAERISGKPERIALFSSAGPAADGRIKPDVCAPGTNLPAPRSSRIAGAGWGVANPAPHYMYLGGTSIATGVAGGVAAVVRQAWKRHLGTRAPSGAALKALLILGAQPVVSRDGAGPERREVAGFGRLNIAGSLPVQPWSNVTLVDGEEGLSTGGSREIPVEIGRVGAFRAVLAWYDVPAGRLVNDLDLCLEDAAGRRVWGNHPPGGDGQPDRCNSVEVIDLPALAAGVYRLRVEAANVPSAPQRYALALRFPVTGAAASGSVF